MERRTTWKANRLDIEIFLLDGQSVRLSGHKKMDISVSTFYVFSTYGILLKSIEQSVIYN